MTRSFRALPTVVVAVVLVSSIACNKTSTTIPTPTLVTEDFSGTIPVGGSDNKSFNVNYSYSGTDASITLKSVTSVATGAALSIPIGLGFGTFNTFDGSCVIATGASNTNFNVGESHGTQGGVFGPGTYCVSAFDPVLRSGQALTEAVKYTYSVSHY
jgi:hypothetical protein